MTWLIETRAIVAETIRQSLDDGLPGRGAALSYYVILSLGPLLVLLMGALEMFLSGAQVRTEVVVGIREAVGTRAADVAATVIARVDPPDLLAPESIVTILVLLFGATAVFANIRGSLNAIWGIEPSGGSRREDFLRLLRGRARAFLMVTATGVLLAVSFAATSATGLLGSFLARTTMLGPRFVQSLDALVSVVLTGLLFGMIFLTLPEVRIRWSTVWVGAFATAALFTVGKLLVTRLLATASWTSYYGPGASVVAFLAWVYFSAQIFYIGAEFTQVWSTRRDGVLSRDGPSAA